jgi:ABC-type spermidine/putrescine transport system permease subunit II
MWIFIPKKTLRLEPLVINSICSDYNNLQIEIFCRCRKELQPQINALSILLITAPVFFLLVAEFIRAFHHKK